MSAERAISADRVLEDIRRFIEEEACKTPGLGEVAARTIAQASVDRISEHLGGQKIYITKDASIAKRHREIWADFRGDNFSELATKYRLAEPYVRQVVNRMRIWERERRQRDLFSAPEV